jgi:hypothetical protein
MLADIEKDASEIKDFPRDVEKAFILTRLQELRRYLGPNDPTLRGLLAGRTPDELASFLADSSALADTSGFRTLFTRSYMSSKDASVPVIDALGPLYFTLGQQNDHFSAREDNLNAALARARFEVFGTDVPPDATFSLRLSDGVVGGYAYNGTVAPPVTTFYGLYDHYFTYGKGTDWDLPERWLTPPAEFDMSTPLNLVSTNDITGGNSGSPLLNKNLEIVGLVFDGNIESLPNEYLYSDDRARTISVDARGMMEVLGTIYGANRLVLELRTGQLATTDEEADALLQGVGKR